MCYAISGCSAHTTMCAKLLHYFCVQEHKKIAKEKVAKASCCQFRKHLNQQARWTSKSQNIVIVSVLLTNAPSIQTVLTHGAIATKMSFIKTKNSTAKGTKSGKTSTHKANLMDIEPAEKVTHHASSLEITAISESELSGDELNAYMLDSFNTTLGCLSNNLSVAKKAMAADKPTGMSFDSIQALDSLEEATTHHLDEISLTAEQQAINYVCLTLVCENLGFWSRLNWSDVKECNSQICQG
jgi:hypothetical protein